MDGIRIQTDPSLPFYLSYRTQNAGVSGYYPDVSSIDTSEAVYAGSAGKPIQRVGIYVFDKNGNKMVTDVVVMYRARVNGVWQPWVSNADPGWMQSVHSQYNLMGTLDTSSGHTGIAGQNIDGLEIRAFSGQSNYHPIENLPGAEYTPSLSWMADSTSSWTSFTQKATADHMDGIRIQTDASKEYYLYYRTKNAGKSDYYPFVRSDDTAASAYAGSAGKPIQRLGIQVYRKSDGAKLDTGVVVMYRVYANGHWLKWVSNATRDWMESAKAKYNLDGSLDYTSGYAGLDGYNIKGVEIRIFEENNTDDTPSYEPTGNYKIITGVPHIYQKDPNSYFPSGCESVSAVMALRYAKFNVSVADFVDNYLDKLPRNNFHPNVAFGGDPRQNDYGCYAPVIHKAINKILALTNYEAKELHDVPLATLCSEYIDNDIPVILWATAGMQPWYYTGPLYYNGTAFSWIAPEHCLLLVGYDDNYYYFNDPLRTSAKTRYWKADVEAAYAGLLKQAVVIVKNRGTIPPIIGYEQPPIPSVNPIENPSITSFINILRAIEDGYLFFKYGANAHEKVKQSTDPTAILNILRAQAYNDEGSIKPEWQLTTGRDIDWEIVTGIQLINEWSLIQPYVQKTQRKSLSDGDRGLIDLPHMAVVAETYLSNGIVPKFWASWGGDLASGMADTTKRIANKSKYDYDENATTEEIANNTIGNENSSCNYTDFCSDFDAYKISQMLQQEYAAAEKESEPNFHILSDVIQRYYTQTTNLFKQRFYWILEELGCSGSSVELINFALQTKMTEKYLILGISPTPIDVILMFTKGDNPSEEVKGCCYKAFASYIYTMLHK